MAINIVQKNNPILRQKAKEVPQKEITSGKIKVILRQMRQALDGEKDGVAIAAPQIEVPLRIFIISRKVLGTKEKPAAKDLVFINPSITKLSKKKESLEEGCLSVRWLYGIVHRAHKATVRAYDEKGKAFTRGASGLLAQIFQHETDHLDGILFIDKAKNLRELPPEKRKQEGSIRNQGKTKKIPE